ncbi:hypothetical protein Tco_0482052 [Tanacetum coccineum]
MSASIEARIAEHAATPIPPISPAYDQAPLGHRAAMIRIRDDIPEEDMPLRRRFILTAPPSGCDVVESSAAAKPPKDDDEDVGAEADMNNLDTFMPVSSNYKSTQKSSS